MRGSYTALLRVGVVTALSCAFLAAGSSPASALDTTRISGADRYLTAIEISQANWTVSNEVIIATGEDFPDALSAAGLSGAHAAPLLLVGDQVTTALAAELTRLGVTQVIIVGGEVAVGANIQQELEQTYTVTRISGDDRYATSRAVADEMHNVTSIGDTVLVARGDDFPDALALAPLCWNKIPILLTPPDSFHLLAGGYVAARNVQNAYIAGGTNAVSAAAKDELDLLLAVNGGSDSVRWSGPDRYATAAAVAGGAIDDVLASHLDMGVATGVSFPDALAGAAYMGANNGTMVLTDPDALPQATETFFAAYSDLFTTEVTVFGGEGAVSKAVLDYIRGLG